MKRALWWYRLALLLYPGEFRQRFGGEMEATFAAAYRTARSRRKSSVARLWVETLVQILAFAAVEWIEPVRRRFRRHAVVQHARSRSKTSEPLMSLVHDLKIGVRTLSHRPSFTLAAVLTLGLGVGVNTAVFSVVHGIMWRQLAYDRPEELVVLWPNRSFSTREVVFLREHTTMLDGIATVAGWSVALTDVEQPTQLSGARTSANVFRLLGVAPILGRTFVDDDVAVGSAPVAMLSHTLWTTRFGADSSLIGGTLTVDGLTHQVVGVMPPSFEILGPNTELWIPLIEDPNRWEYLGNVSQAFGRLASGVTLGAAEGEFHQLVDRMRETLGYPEDFGPGASLEGLKERLVGGYRMMFLVLLGAVGFILLIAGSNLSSLLLAKAVHRRREMAMRAALGATRRRLIQVVLTESGLLSAAGGLVGLALAFVCVVLLKVLVPESTPRAASIAVDLPVLFACFAFALSTGLIFSVAPAATMTRLNLQRDVGGARTAGQSGSSSHRLRQGFVVLQVALAVMLVVGAGLMIRSMRELATVQPGFEYDDVLTLRLFPVGSRYDTAVEYRRFYLDLFERLEAIPGVEAVGAVQHLPLSGTAWGTPVEIEGRPVPDGQSRPIVGWRIVTGRYFESMGIRVLEGRTFARTDESSSTPVAVVNRTFAQRFWREESALGRRFKHGRTSDTWVTVVGVVDDVLHFELGEDPIPELYRPQLQSTMPAMMLAVHTSGSPERLARQVQSVVWAFDPNVPISEVVPMAELVSGSYGDSRLVMTLLTVFAAVALSLGAVGVYGVTSYAVSQRINEIGLRMALGASDRRVRGEVLRLGVTNALVGTALGLAGALGLARFLKGFVFGVSATDPATFVAVAACIAFVALAASYVPARRATKIDPAAALRSV
jgi:predicted permease